MTYRELFEALIQKGYQSRPCNQHMQGPYCCARAVLDDAELAATDPAHADDMLRDFLELDRKEVFRVWYGEELHHNGISRNDAMKEWMFRLNEANFRHLALADIDSCVGYILQNP